MRINRNSKILTLWMKIYLIDKVIKTNPVPI